MSSVSDAKLNELISWYTGRDGCERNVFDALTELEEYRKNDWRRRWKSKNRGGMEIVTIWEREGWLKYVTTSGCQCVVNTTGMNGRVPCDVDLVRLDEPDEREMSSYFPDASNERLVTVGGSNGNGKVRWLFDATDDGAIGPVWLQSNGGVAPTGVFTLILREPNGRVGKIYESMASSCPASHPISCEFKRGDKIIAESDNCKFRMSVNYKKPETKYVQWNHKTFPSGPVFFMRKCGGAWLSPTAIYGDCIVLFDHTESGPKKDITVFFGDLLERYDWSPDRSDKRVCGVQKT